MIDEQAYVDSVIALQAQAEKGIALHPARYGGKHTKELIVDSCKAIIADGTKAFIQTKNPWFQKKCEWATAILTDPKFV